MLGVFETVFSNPSSVLSLQYRSRDAASRGDKYMLVSFDEPSVAVKVGSPVQIKVDSNFITLMTMFLCCCGHDCENYFPSVS